MRMKLGDTCLRSVTYGKITRYRQVLTAFRRGQSSTSEGKSSTTGRERETHVFLLDPTEDCQRQKSQGTSDCRIRLQNALVDSENSWHDNDNIRLRSTRETQLPKRVGFHVKLETPVGLSSPVTDIWNTAQQKASNDACDSSINRGTFRLRFIRSMEYASFNGKGKGTRIRE